MINPFIIFFLCMTFVLNAQIGGSSTYEFLNLSNSARITALGGSLITVKDRDINLAYHNPAALNEKMHRSVSFNQSVYMGTTYGYLAYGHSLKQFDLPVTLQAGLHYISYGDFNNYDPNGTFAGQTNASEYALNLGASYQMSSFLSVGANMKTILSYLGPYNSVGMAFDLAAMYADTSKHINLSVAFRNVGTQFSAYDKQGNLEPLPFDLQIGFAHKLKYIPLRFSVILHNLHRWGIVYDDPNFQDDQILIVDNTSNTDDAALKTVDDIFRHFIFNLELLFGKKGKEEVFRIAAGYNHMRRGELTAGNLNDLAGFSFGFGIRVKQFYLDYGFGSFHYAGAAHHIGLSVNLDEILNGAFKKTK